MVVVTYMIYQVGEIDLLGRFLTGLGVAGLAASLAAQDAMKSFFGIEKLKLKGKKVDGGYVVRGALPWVSNLGPDHFFGTIFERDDEAGGIVMFLSGQPDSPLLA